MVNITLIDQLLLKITLFDWLIDWLIDCLFYSKYYIINRFMITITLIDGW